MSENNTGFMLLILIVNSFEIGRVHFLFYSTNITSLLRTNLIVNELAHYNFLVARILFSRGDKRPFRVRKIGRKD